MQKEFTLKFEQQEDGLWFMTNGEDRTIFVCHRDIEAIISDLPEILRLWLKRSAAT